MNMNVYRFVATCGLSGGALTIAGSCGGTIATDYLDDAGVYHAGDGAVFAPGSACVGWEASHLNDPAPSCNPMNQTDPVCSAWVPEFSPPGFPYNSSLCASNAVNDEFCTAWLQQFLVKGKAVSICFHAPNLNLALGCSVSGDTNGIGICEGTAGTLAFVNVDGGLGCSLPCAP